MQEERITKLLADWQQGDRQAETELFRFVYPYLHHIAASRLRSRKRTLSLDTTDLVHEAYLRLDAQRQAWVNRNQFFAIAARVMRYLILDHLRQKDSLKRGGAAETISLQQVDPGEEGFSVDALALDELLTQLEDVDRHASQTVEMRYFGGMTIAEIADHLGVSPSTIERRWRFARAWLKRKM